MVETPLALAIANAEATRDGKLPITLMIIMFIFAIAGRAFIDYHEVRNREDAILNMKCYNDCFPPRTWYYRHDYFTPPECWCRKGNNFWLEGKEEWPKERIW